MFPSAQASSFELLGTNETKTSIGAPSDGVRTEVNVTSGVGRMVFRIRANAEPASVADGALALQRSDPPAIGGATPGWSYDASKKTAIVWIPDATSVKLVLQ